MKISCFICSHLVFVHMHTYFLMDNIILKIFIACLKSRVTEEGSFWNTQNAQKPGLGKAVPEPGAPARLPLWHVGHAPLSTVRRKLDPECSGLALSVWGASVPNSSITHCTSDASQIHLTCTSCSDFLKKLQVVKCYFAFLDYSW